MEEHKDTLASLNVMGHVLQNMKGYEGADNYDQQALRGHERIFGKTHPDTLLTIMKMANVYCVGLEDFAKAEEMYRQVLDGREKSLGRDVKDTMDCAFQFADMLCDQGRQDDLQEVVAKYPFIVDK